MIDYVVKRNGNNVPYERQRIFDAIKKAIIATKQEVDPTLVTHVVEDIETAIEVAYTTTNPKVEEIQDLVEAKLVEHNLYDVSKSYILYRAKRAEERIKGEKERYSQVEEGKLNVRNPDGTTSYFDTDKVTRFLTKKAKDLGTEISIPTIIKELIKTIYDGITTTEILDALILSIASFIERDPAYNKLVSRIFMHKMFREILPGEFVEDLLSKSYQKSFQHAITEGVSLQIYDKRLLDFDLDVLANTLQPKRDDLLTFIGIQTLYERYFVKTKEKRIELPQSFWMRVAMGLSLSEEKSERTKRAISFYNILSTLRFVSSTPTLFHAGLTHPQLSSCYLSTVEDDLQHIFKCLGDNAQMSKWSGGIGNDWTNVRATGANILSTRVESQGVIPFLKIANDVTVAINRSGKRRGATCAYLETWHLDIEEFLDLRKNTGDDRRRTHDMNTSNWIPDLFMKRVLAGKSWTLFSPDDVPELHHLYGAEFEAKYEEYERLAKAGKIRKHKIVEAVKLWRRMLTRLFETGHPWITFKDPSNIRSPQDHAGVVHNSNLCTEITLNTSSDETAVCNLGSINLARHVTIEGIDKELLAETAKLAIRMLDNVIDVNFYPTKEAENANLKHRAIGLGIMGFQDALFTLDIPFASNDAITFADELQELISYHAIMGSSLLAKEKGTYKSYVGSKWERGIFPFDTIALLEQERGVPVDVNRNKKLDWRVVKEHVKQYGMRNSNTMAIAPTATIANISGVFPCIEPIFKNIYVKANMNGEFTVVNHFLIEDLKKINLWNAEMLEQLKYYDGDLEMITAIPSSLKRKYKEAFDIDPIHLMKITAARGKWIDQSQSHNVFLKGVSGSLLSEVYITAWKLGLKTTYYLRTLAASQIEKSTLDAKKFGYTQKRVYKESDVSNEQKVESKPEVTPATQVTNVCSVLDPECESCQ